MASDADGQVVRRTSESIGRAELAVERAFATGRADRAEITGRARDAALEAVRRADEAMEADEAADEAARLSVIAQGMGDRERARLARERARTAALEARRRHERATGAARVAFEQIRFSDPAKLGLMRLVQVLFATHILLSVAVLLLTSRDTVSYDSANFTDWIVVVAESVGLWFFSRRLRLARPLCIGIGVFGISMSAITLVASGSFTLSEFLLESASYVFLICYFTFSARVGAVLVNELSHQTARPVLDDLAVERTGWPFVRNLIIYFFVFSLLGHWLEAALCQLIRLGLVQGSYDPRNTMLWRDWFYPYPMHGCAVVLIALLLYPLFDHMRHALRHPWQAYAVSYVAGAVTCAAIELTGGLMFNRDYQHWDYRDDFMNFMGQIDLQNTLAFGCAAAVITWIVYPTLERAISRVRPAVMNVVCIIVAAIGTLLFSLYVISPPEGIDLGARDTALSDGDVAATALDESLTAVERELARLEDAVDASAGLDRDGEAAARERIARIEGELAGLVDREWGDATATATEPAGGAGETASGRDADAGDAEAGA